MTDLAKEAQQLSAIEKIAELMPGGFFIYRADETQALLYANEATLRIFGCETLEEFKELTGYTFRGLVHPEDYAAVQSSIESQIADAGNGNMDSVTYRIIQKNGNIRWVDDYGYFAELDGYGKAYCVFISDITGKLDIQEQKRKAELELERERHASEIKSQFLFNVSHDIRTPMNAIMGFAGLAKRHMTEPERLKDCLDRVERSGSQLLALIDDLLDMSKLEHGRIEIRTEPCQLREQIGMVLDLFRAQAEEKHLTLDEQLELPDKAVLVDANRFRRVMSNLVSNAVKFTPANGTVTVSARQKQVSGSGYARYEFTVSDTGIGMSSEFMPHMYEAFAQESSSTKAGTAGAGLGLSIVKSLLNIMGGSISADSRKGQGSVFTVSLPLKYVDHIAEEAPDARGIAEHHAGGERRVLLVEDIEINRMLAETILEEAGFLVDAVPDGCDAVDAVQNHPMRYYDLILMDIQMPVMNGYEAARAIRSINREDIPSLPIIALSANARDEDKRMSMESGMNDHIAKPFDVTQLISTIHAHIAARDPENT